MATDDSTRDWRLFSFLALSKFDPIWSDTLRSSVLVSVGSHATERLSIYINKFGHWVVRAGAIAESLSAIFAFVLLAVLPLPQFAADKEGLAVLAACGIALCVLSRMVLLNKTDSSSAVDMLVLALLGSYLASTFASHYFQASCIGFIKELIYIGSYFWFVAVIAATRKRSISAVSILLVSGFLTALYGLHQYQIGVEPLATWEDPTVEQKAIRIYSTLGNPNLLAGYLTSLAPLAFALSFLSFFKQRYILSTVSFVAALTLCAAIVLTGSRGAYIALGAWLSFLLAIICSYTVRHKRVSRLYLLLPAIGIVLAAFAAIHFLPSLGQRITSIFAGSEHSSNAFRLNVWRASLRMFLDNWWLGIGPGNKTFILAYGLYMVSGFDALGTYCVPLEVAVETGIAGLLVFAGLFVTILSRTHLVFKAADNDIDRWLSAGCAAALTGIMVHGLVDTVFFRPQIQFVFWLLVALIASAYQRTFYPESPNA